MQLTSVKQLPPLISVFHERHPLVTFDLYTATADHVKAQMDRGLMDIGLLLEPIDIPLAEKESITAKELSKRTLIPPWRRKGQGELACWFGDDYESLSVLFASNLSTNAAILVSRGWRSSLRGAVPFWDQKKITHRPLSPTLTAKSVLAWKWG